MSGSHFILYDDGCKRQTESARPEGQRPEVQHEGCKGQGSGSHPSGNRRPEGVAEGMEGRPRQQLAALVFHKSANRRAPMSLRVLVPSVATTTTRPTPPPPPLRSPHSEAAPLGGGEGGRGISGGDVGGGVVDRDGGVGRDLLEDLLALPEGTKSPPEGSELLNLVPPRWNEAEAMYQARVLHSPLTTHHSPLTTHHPPLTTHHSPLAIRHSP